MAINHFATDSQEELDWLIDACEKLGVKAIIADEFTMGGEGMKTLATEVVNATESYGNQFTPLYDLNLSIKEKVEILAKKFYGAEKVNFEAKANTQLKMIQELGMNNLPVCMAKTQKSLSDNEKLYGRPTGFTMTVREFEFAAGAGFVIPILGNMMRMPGLPAIPAAENMNIDANGTITGLS